MISTYKLWLGITLSMVIALMLIGAATRLTDSGLSIPDWDLLIGVIPPISEKDWQQSFDRYQQFSEYKLQNSHFTIIDFKTIFLWEYAHRMIGRLVGLFFGLGLLGLIVTRNLPTGTLLPSLGLLFLGGMQGVIGIWMVRSGLINRIDVEPARLAIHLLMALALASGLLWMLLPKHIARSRQQTRSHRNLAIAAVPLVIWIFAAALIVTTTMGALTAGSDAGYLNNSWPTYSNGTLLAPGYEASLWLTDQSTIQSNHRNAAYITAIIGLVLSSIAPGLANKLTLFVLIITQLIMGIITVTLAVPILTAVIHQALAISLFLFVIYLIKSQLYLPSSSSSIDKSINRSIDPSLKNPN